MGYFDEATRREIVGQYSYPRHLFMFPERDTMVIKDTSRPFWIIYDATPGGYVCGTKEAFNDEPSAFKEAERLAQANPGRTYAVLKAVGTTVTKNVVTTRF